MRNYRHSGLRGTSCFCRRSVPDTSSLVLLGVFRTDPCDRFVCEAAKLDLFESPVGLLVPARWPTGSLQPKLWLR